MRQTQFPFPKKCITENRQHCALETFLSVFPLEIEEKKYGILGAFEDFIKRVLLETLRSYVLC